MDESPPLKTVLFLCTGNYYRSRFAEEVFNYHAQKRGLGWRADSAGLKVREMRHQNPGPISLLAVNAFKEYGIEPRSHDRNPQQVVDASLETADLIIATSLVEHQPMVEEHIPQFAEKVSYWDVEDVGFEDPVIALKNLHEKTLGLLQSLRQP